MTGEQDLATGYVLSEEIDAAAAHAFLTQSYWAAGIAPDTVARSIAGSLVTVAVRHGGAQVGMARVVSDGATIAYLTDVYVLEGHRRLGLAGAMIARLRAHPLLQGLRHWLLFTHDAHRLYERFGWSVYEHPRRTMILSGTAASA